MSRSSDRSASTSRSSDRSASKSRPSDSAQVEPLAALVAVFAVGAALTTYAGVLDATLTTTDRNLAEPTVERVERTVSEAGVVEPPRLSEGVHAGPDGYRVALTLVAGDRTWHAGPTPPTRGDSSGSTTAQTTSRAIDTAEITVSVRVGPGQIRAGRLRAEVWR